MDKRSQEFNALLRSSGRFVQLMGNVADRNGRSYGISAARLRVLGPLRNGSKTVPGIARFTGVSRQSVQRLVDELEADGLVNRTPNPDHKTAKLIELTKKGEQSVAKFLRDSDEWAQKFLPEFDAKKLRAAAKLLDRIREAVLDYEAD